MEVFIFLIALVCSILSIVLFFKIWGMTNDVNAIRSLLENRIMYNDAVPPTGAIDAKPSDNGDGIHESHKVTRLSDNRKLYVEYISGDTYKCLDPTTKGFIGYYKISEIRKGW